MPGVPDPGAADRQESEVHHLLTTPLVTQLTEPTWDIRVADGGRTRNLLVGNEVPCQLGHNDVSYLAS